MPDIFFIEVSRALRANSSITAPVQSRSCCAAMQPQILNIGARLQSGIEMYYCKSCKDCVSQKIAVASFEVRAQTFLTENFHTLTCRCKRGVHRQSLEHNVYKISLLAIFYLRNCFVIYIRYDCSITIKPCLHEDYRNMV